MKASSEKKCTGAFSGSGVPLKIDGRKLTEELNISASCKPEDFLEVLTCIFLIYWLFWTFSMIGSAAVSEIQI